MAEIAVLGYGTVGSGVVEVLNTNQHSIDKKAAQPIRIKYILDIREFPGDPMERFITKNFDDILNDNDIQVVVEVLGGVEPAYTFVKSCLLRGKSVVTSNKELVAAHGAELLAIAREKNINFLFEASVGGGIPIIRPLNQSLTADEIQEITGILNGTTNYILSKMSDEGIDFDTALKDAQERGYAERNPAADVEGFDACRKIAILTSLAIGRQVDFEDIYTEGITKITKTDIQYAKAISSSIKLLASAKIMDNKHAYAKVSPVIVGHSHPLSMVNDVFNAIFVKGNVIGEVMFYGQGAGKLPTASAVVADVVDAVRHLNRNIMFFWSSEKLDMMNLKDVKVSKLVRLQYGNKDAALSRVITVFGDIQVIHLPYLQDEFAIITPSMTESELEKNLEQLLKDDSIKSILNAIPMEKQVAM